jgi:hypothetical protein
MAAEEPEDRQKKGSDRRPLHDGRKEHIAGGARARNRALFAEVAVQVAQCLGVELAPAERFAEEREGRESLGNHLLFLDDGQGGADFPFGLCLLAGLEKRIGDDQVDGRRVASHAHVFRVANRLPIGFDRFAKLALLPEDVSDAPAELDQSDLTLGALEEIQGLPSVVERFLRLVSKPVELRQVVRRRGEQLRGVRGLRLPVDRAKDVGRALDVSRLAAGERLEEAAFQPSVASASR